MTRIFGPVVNIWYSPTRGTLTRLQFYILLHDVLGTENWSAWIFSSPAAAKSPKKAAARKGKKAGERLMCFLPVTHTCLACCLSTDLSSFGIHYISTCRHPQANSTMRPKTEIADQETQNTVSEINGMGHSHKFGVSWPGCVCHAPWAVHDHTASQIIKFATWYQVLRLTCPKVLLSSSNFSKLTTFMFDYHSFCLSMTKIAFSSKTTSARQ